MKKTRFLSRRQPGAYALTLAILYVVVGFLWIAFSDQAVARLTDDPDLINQLQTIKGFFFVFMTGLIFFLFAWWMGQRLLRSNRLAQWSRRDPLTGLAGRNQLLEDLSRQLEQQKNGSAECAVIVLDVSRFRRINESFGVRVGDGLLIQLAHRLRTEVPASGFLSRPGSDHFVIIPPLPTSREETGDLATRLIQASAAPFQVAGRPLRLRVDAGIAMSPGDGTNAQSLLQQASTAIFDAKQQERASISFSQPTGRADKVEEVSLESDLDGALERDEFTLVFQPQIDLARGDIIGCEALLRWRHPEYGLIPPSRFIPLLEQNGEIVPVGRWVIEQASRQFLEWREEVSDDFQITVNLSRRQLWDPELIPMLEGILADYSIAPKNLALEITETLAMQDPAITRSVLAELQGMGFQLSLDDFGSGYSCLSYLGRYPLDILKIDRSFVAGSSDDERNLALLEVILHMARRFQLITIAEGVESEEEARILLGLGCQQAQGYWFARPMPAEDFARLLTRNHGRLIHELSPIPRDELEAALNGARGRA